VVITLSNRERHPNEMIGLPKQDLQIRDMLKVLVGGGQRQPALNRKRSHPNVILWNGRSSPGQLRGNLAVVLRCVLIGREDVSSSEKQLDLIQMLLGPIRLERSVVKFSQSWPWQIKFFVSSQFVAQSIGIAEVANDHTTAP
jgi:hypothetical protein